MLLTRRLQVGCTFQAYFHFQGLWRHASHSKKILPPILILLLLCTPMGHFLDTTCVTIRSKKRPRFGGHFLFEFRVTPKCNTLFGSRPRPQNWGRARCQHKGQKTTASPSCHQQNGMLSVWPCPLTRHLRKASPCLCKPAILGRSVAQAGSQDHSCGLGGECGVCAAGLTTGTCDFVLRCPLHWTTFGSRRPHKSAQPFSQTCGTWGSDWDSILQPWLHF